MTRPVRALIVVLSTVALACGPTDPSPVPSSSPSGSATAAPSASAEPTVGSPTPAASPSAAFDPAGLTVRFEPIVEGFDDPLGVTHAGDGSGRIFVLEQVGRVRIVRDGQLGEEPFLDISDRVRSGGEQGLLGLAFHPDYPADPRLFVNYSDERGDTIIASFTVDPADPDRADPSSETRILFVNQPFANHNGGALAFDPDGFLAIATGDGGGSGDPERNGQNLNSHLGKILRLDVDGTVGDQPYAIPPDNPFPTGDGGLPEVWLTGLRNPWRMAFDRATGDLWIGDVGQNAWEEIDVLRAGSAGGANYGWNLLEGTHCYRGGCDGTGFVAPVAEYSHDVGCTVIGGTVYRGAAQPALAGGYVFGDFCSGIVWAIDPTGDQPREPTVVGETGATISSFGEDEAGELYVTDLAAGTLSRVVAERP